MPVEKRSYYLKSAFRAKFAVAAMSILNINALLKLLTDAFSGKRNNGSKIPQQVVCYR